MLKNGINMWDEKQDNTRLGLFRKKFKRNYNALGSNAHLTEQGVKVLGYFSFWRRGESTSSILALERGDTVEEIGILFRNYNKNKKIK